MHNEDEPLIGHLLGWSVGGASVVVDVAPLLLFVFPPDI